MNLATMFAVFAVKGAAAADPGPGPTGPPTGLSVVNGGTEVSPLARIHWTNGDATAYTRIYKRVSNCSGAESLLTTVNPGITSFDSSITVAAGFLVSHYRNGQESAKTSCVAWDGS